jgi:UDP-N-acetylmuramate--alanine ligase
MNQPDRFLPREDVERLLASARPGHVIHLVGAGGCGMSGLGHLLLDLGLQVTGSDLVCGLEVEQLRQRGARIEKGHTTSFDAPGKPLFVVQTSAVRAENPEIRQARARGIPVVRRGVLLAALAHRERAVCVAGMHGKTTTTALLAHAMEQLGLAPSYAIGALLNSGSRHARLSSAGAGASSFFVLEADESDGTLGQFHPEQAILLNVDAEHLDFFGGIDRVCEAFAGFASQVKDHLIYCKDDPHLNNLCASRARAVSYGFHPGADYRLQCFEGPADAGETQSFEALHQGVSLGRFGLRLLGEKNASNALAVIALLRQLGHDPGAIAGAIAGFGGACRRQQLLLAGHGVRVYDDYGHHPSEIRVTLQALRQAFGGRLVVAFQPHRYTRTQHLMADFATAFAQADVLWLTEVYPASEPPIAGVDGAVLARAVRASGQAAHYVPRVEELTAAVLGDLQSGDTVLFLGAGDITQAAHATAAHLARAGLARRPSDVRPAETPDTSLAAPLGGTLLQWVC